MEVTIENKGAFLRIVPSGEMNHQFLDEYTNLIVDAAIDAGVTKVLLDQQGMEENKTTMLDAYEFSESGIIEFGALNGFRVACLPSPANFEAAMAYETALRNRSLNFRNFTDEEEALAWLLS